MLTFNVKKVWFDKIKNGEKTHEYREYKPYWKNRLEKCIGTDFSAISLRHGKVIRIKYPHIINFVCGYARKEDITKRLEARLLTIKLVDGRETDLKINKPVYDIKFKLIKDKEFGKEIILNIETVGKSCPMGRYYFSCKECINQSISDDEGTCYSCNNYVDIWNDDENKFYCKNYVNEVNNDK